MSLPLELVLEFLGRSAAWLGAVALVSAALAAAAVMIARVAGRAPSWRRAGLWALLGALLSASLIDRFEVPTALQIEVWRRDLAVVWAVAGAALGAGAAVLLPARTKGAATP